MVLDRSARCLGGLHCSDSCRTNSLGLAVTADLLEHQQLLFARCSLAGLQDGEPAKLYLPRDFSGAYCDLEQNWNSGPNLKGLLASVFHSSACPQESQEAALVS